MTDRLRELFDQVKRRIPLRRPSVIVYSPANMNAIDGSSIWAQKVTLAFARVPNADVSFLLSHPATTDRLLRPIIDEPHVRLIDPFKEGLTTATGALPPDEAARLLTAHARPGPQAFVVRGSVMARRLAAEPALHGRLWPYLTDIPQQSEMLDEESRAGVEEIIGASHFVLCQTPELLEYMESEFESLTGKARLLPPIVPEEIDAHTLEAPMANHLELCYSGKFARLWNTLEMCELPALLRMRGVNAKLTMIGDKINRDSERPEFVADMKYALENTPEVDWVGGVSHAESLRLMSNAHVGLSWRSPEMSTSLELSTKLLEYCAVGTPPILNRTTMHERLFGSGYPFFAETSDDVVGLLTTLVEDRDLYESTVADVASVPDEFTINKASDRLSSIVDELR